MVFTDFSVLDAKRKEERSWISAWTGWDGCYIPCRDHPHPPPPICLFVPVSMFLVDAFLWLSHGQLNEIPPSSIIMWLDLL